MARTRLFACAVVSRLTLKPRFGAGGLVGLADDHHRRAEVESPREGCCDRRTNSAPAMTAGNDASGDRAGKMKGGCPKAGNNDSRDLLAQLKVFQQGFSLAKLAIVSLLYAESCPLSSRRTAGAAAPGLTSTLATGGTPSRAGDAADANADAGLDHGFTARAVTTSPVSLFQHQAFGTVGGRHHAGRMMPRILGRPHQGSPRSITRHLQSSSDEEMYRTSILLGLTKTTTITRHTGFLSPEFQCRSTAAVESLRRRAGKCRRPRAVGGFGRARPREAPPGAFRRIETGGRPATTWRWGPSLMCRAPPKIQAHTDVAARRSSSVTTTLIPSRRLGDDRPF